MSTEKTTIVIRVWDKKTEKLLFEGGVNEVTENEGKKIIALMGKQYAGTGDFHISVERIVEPGDQFEEGE